MMKTGIYCLCRDKETIVRLEKETKRYSFKDINFITGPDYFTFLRNIIENDEYDYSLVIHDDVIMPINMLERIESAIKKADATFGHQKWGVLGNAGISYLNNEAVTFIRDPHTSLIPYNTVPIPVVHIDGNTLLLNIKNIQCSKVEIPKSLTGFHLYDFVLVSEMYKKGLVAAIDPSLYVYHKSGGNQKDFDKVKQSLGFTSYIKDNYINHAFYTINGLVEIENDIKYLPEPFSNKRSDFYVLIEKVVNKLDFAKKKKELVIVVRTQLGRLNYLKRLLDSIKMGVATKDNNLSLGVVLSINNSLLNGKEIDDIYLALIKEYPEINLKLLRQKKVEGYYPRVTSLNNAVEQIEFKNDSYIWIVDDDDFIFPSALTTLVPLLQPSSIIIGEAIRFDEKWDSENSVPSNSKAINDHFNSQYYFKNVFGDNYVPISAVFYPLDVLKDILSNYELKGDYYEDYAIFLLAQNLKNTIYYPVKMVGVSYHGKNTVMEKDRSHWDYSLVTFISEAVNKGIVKKWVYDLCKSREPMEKQLIEYRMRLQRWCHVFKIAKPFIKLARKFGFLKQAK